MVGLLDWLVGLFGGGKYGVDELARRLGMGEDELRAVQPAYREFAIPKRAGGTRKIQAPEPTLRLLQQRIHRRVLGRLKSHPCATGFEKGHSIVTNALHHAGRVVVVRMDLRDFFTTTRADRVKRYFRKIGWNREAAGLLTRLCTHDGSLPQGAPTSPRLSNLVNYRLDARLAAFADRFGAAYSRYADDLTFSFDADQPRAVHRVIRVVRSMVGEEGYAAHGGRKLQVRRRHQRQIVTGLVVNAGINLPRETRRWLRAVEHRLATGRETSLTPAQITGWRALQSMIVMQGRSSTAD